MENGCSLAAMACTEGLPDESSAASFLATCEFSWETCFLVDMNFYSEENLGLFRADGKHFIIPVPEETEIGRAMLSNIAFSDSFKDKGEEGTNTILYRVNTVKEAEALYRDLSEHEVVQKNQGASAYCRETGRVSEKAAAGEIGHSAYPDDLVILYQDRELHDSMVNEYAFQIRTDSDYTYEELERFGPRFGTIILRTNYRLTTGIAKDIYTGYNKRRNIVAHYNFARDMRCFCRIHKSDCPAVQGLAFMTTVFGQIRSAFEKRKQGASPCVQEMTIGRCLSYARKLKMSQHMDRTWHIAGMDQDVVDMVTEMGGDISTDFERLNSLHC